MSGERGGPSGLLCGGRRGERGKRRYHVMPAAVGLSGRLARVWFGKVGFVIAPGNGIHANDCEHLLMFPLRMLMRFVWLWKSPKRRIP